MTRLAWFLLVLTIRYIYSQSTEQWDQFELTVSASSSGNPFLDVSLTATFTNKQSSDPNPYTVHGFYDGNNHYKIRFMPNYIGQWIYITHSNIPSINNIIGNFSCTKPSNPNINRGPIFVDYSTNRSFIYADGTEYFSVGTTSYDWINPAISTYPDPWNITLKTISNPQFGFNKLRFSIFPWYQSYNHGPRAFFPYQGTPPTNWDFTRFNITFWQHFDYILESLLNIPNKPMIVAEVVFFTVSSQYYGLSCIGGDNPEKYNTTFDNLYIKYAVSRIASYRNVWWSMANEFDRIQCKNKSIPEAFPIWDQYFQTLIFVDPYRNPQKEKSIHQEKHFYNYSREWTTHFSVQRQYPMADTDRNVYTEMFNVSKPVIFDEVQYEGNVTEKANDLLTAAVEADRFWMGLGQGVYVGHSECMLPNMTDNPDGNSLLWEYAGCELRGGSWKLIKWFREWMNNATDDGRPTFSEMVNKCLLSYDEANGMKHCDIGMFYKENEYYFIHFTEYASNNYYATINVNISENEYDVWELSYIDYVNEKIEVIKNVSGKHFVFTAPEIPYNIQLLKL